LQSNEIALMYCNTSENVADIFTKPLGKIKFELFREMLGVGVNPFSIKGETSVSERYYHGLFCPRFD
jgi:hypothetical protein